MKDLEEIKQVIKDNFNVLRKKYKVKDIGLFGSYVRGEQGKESDIDILVEFEESVSLLTLVSLEDYLTDIIGISVDIVSGEDIRPEPKNRILGEAIYI